MQLGKDIVKFRYLFLALFVGLIILAGVLFPDMMKKVNYDFTSYLPEDYATNVGYEFMSENFNVHGDVEIGIHTNDKEKLSSAVDSIKELDGVSMAVWAGDMQALSSFGVMSADSDDYKELQALFNDGDDWLILVTLTYPPSSQEAITTYNAIKDVLNGDFGDNYYCSGMTMQSAELYSGTVDEIWLYVLIAGILVLIILLLTTNSLMEPVIMLLTIGISIVINLGTNALFPSTSIVTFACSAILQLGLSMDYSIFLLHQYRHELEANPDPKAAMAAAIPKSARAIFSSALTTIGGLLALMVMQFKIGPDLGLAVAKGILFSFLTVLLLQPCLMLIMNKARLKTQHKCLDFRYKQVVKRSIKDRKWVAAVMLPVFVLALLVNIPNMPWSLKYTYVHFMDTPKVSAEMQKPQEMAIQMGNQVILAVPCYSYTVNETTKKQTVDKVYVDKQYEFVNKLEAMKAEGKVAFSLGLFSMMPEGTTIDMSENSLASTFLTNMGFDPAKITVADCVKMIVNYGTAFSAISDDFAMLSSYVNNGYTLYTVGINYKYDVESAESFAILDEIKAAANSTFGELNTVYMTGYTQAAYDFAAVTPNDFMWVTIISVLIIFVILLLTLGSFKFSVMLVALIECGIWINLLLQWVFSGGTVNFMSYMIIGAVQLGATVDYAILITTRYRENRKRLAPTQASYRATTQSAMAVTTSAAILASACLTVALISTNLIVKELCMLVARGAIISAVLVLFVLPALLVLIDKKNGNELSIPMTPHIRKWHKKFKKPKNDKIQVEASSD